MVVSGVNDERLSQLKLADVRSYAMHKGWQRAGTFKDRFAIFKQTADTLDQLLIPMSENVGDYAARMRDVIGKLMETESRTSAAVLNDLFAINADTLRFSLRSSITAGGTVPLDSGLDLIEGARRSLLSAACSVLAPEKLYHARMSRTEAEEFVNACELGQTEHGSFTLTVRCPLTAVEQDHSADADPFARRATEILVRSAVVLAHAIDADQMDSLVRPTVDEIHITANLCDALLRMQPNAEQGALSLSIAWAPSLPQANIREREILFRADQFPKIDWLYRQLRPAVPQAAAPFPGQVDELRGTIGDDGRRQGEIRLSLLHEEELLKARAYLTADQYAIALGAHMSGAAVLVTGLLERRPRLSVVNDIVGFELIAPALPNVNP